MEAQQPQAQHHEREGRAVVEAGLAGQAEAQAVLVPGVFGLDVGGEDRVGGGEHAAQQDRRPERQAQPVDARRQ